MNISVEYATAQSAFLSRLTADQQKAAKERGHSTNIVALVESGRKFDKVSIAIDKSSSVRYFIERDTGIIYGAKSRFAPNLKWYFGTIYKADKWDWSDFHGRPVNDPNVRAVKGYGGYTHYIEV